MKNRNFLLAHLLNCGIVDLFMLDDIGYDITELTDRIPREDLTLERIFSEVVTIANDTLRVEWNSHKDEILENITEELSEFGNELIKEGYDPADFDEFLSLERDKEFVMNEADDIINNGIEMYSNYLDTRLTLKNASFFKRVLPSWNHIQDMIGFAEIEEI